MAMFGDDEDVFDSITWESPAAASSNQQPEGLSGPGFRQSQGESEDPHEPKWEGYLISSVKDPVKELGDTKDAYVSYLVTGKVSVASLALPVHAESDAELDESCDILVPEPLFASAVHRLCVLARASRQRLSGMCCSSSAREAPFG